MKLIFSSIFCLIFLNSNSQNLRVKDKILIDGKGKNILLKGIGLGGWMLQEPYMLQLSGIASTQQDIKNKMTALVGVKNTEKFYEAWLNNHCTKTDIDSLAAWGFNSIRLPMHFNLFTLPVEHEPVKGKNTWLKKGFTLTDSLLKWCKANKIYLILDLHAAPGGQGNDIAISDWDTTKASFWKSKQNQQKTIALWQKLAARYANEEWIGGYDIINEPNYGFENINDKHGCAENLNIPLRKFYIDVTAAIRKIDKKHIIFIEGNCWGNNYNGIFPLWDDKLVISFHKYWNYTNVESIQKFLDVREQYQVPIWMGETGENSNTWFTDVLELCEKNNIGWAMWPLKKLGINNPYQIPSNKNYSSIIDYWRGKAEKPSKDNAIAGLMQLATDIKAENNIYHKDVIDAMMRQVKSTGTVPFIPHLIDTSLIVFTVDYDMGRSRYAYYDKDSGNYWVSTNTRTDWNKGKMYRNDGVDIQTCTDSITNGFSVGSIEVDEWMQYTINNSDKGVFNIEVRSSAKDSSGALSLIINDKIRDTVMLPQTNDIQHWRTSIFKNIIIPEGENHIKIVVTKGGFNLNYLKFNRIFTTTN